MLSLDNKMLYECIYEPVQSFRKSSDPIPTLIHKRESDVTDMLPFFGQIHEAPYRNSEHEVIAFFLDFSKAFYKEPLRELLRPSTKSL